MVSYYVTHSLHDCCQRCVTRGLEGLKEHKAMKTQFSQANIAHKLFSHSKLCLFECCANVLL